ncbi:coenzyme F420-0:L-glutamate ligase [Nitrososphaera viennensis]|uniref:Coenzyme F420-0:L-glutamate ligase n=1 Tax=Nitrososphaera viennensis TaxID=1034015 RepID=A0A977IE72_9ARCH|nr:coenzyme F420-0:L-glutamate ligase [Nitrososphaera viennensis]UVS69135.1 coenzyme F420-0:L-glutamate ligase [Nitrososphaera viennensis]
MANAKARLSRVRISSLRLEILAVKVARKSGKFSLFESLLQQGFDYKDGDIIVVSSKFVSMAEGSVVDMRRIRVSKKARALAKKCHMEPKLAELVLRESDYIVKGVPGFLLAIRDGMIAPNAGIDKSNVPKGFAILYPRDPFASAEGLKDAFLANLGIKVGIVIADSRLMPTRIGTTGVAIACAGFEPVEDLRGKKDLFGNVLRVTFRAVADGLATMGVAAMGESDESTPAAVVRGARVQWTNKKLSWRDMAVAPEQDIYLRGLKSEL